MIPSKKRLRSRFVTYEEFLIFIEDNSEYIKYNIGNGWNPKTVVEELKVTDPHHKSILYDYIRKLNREELKASVLSDVKIKDCHVLNYSWDTLDDNEKDIFLNQPLIPDNLKDWKKMKRDIARKNSINSLNQKDMFGSDVVAKKREWISKEKFMELVPGDKVLIRLMVGDAIIESPPSDNEEVEVSFHSGPWSGQTLTLIRHQIKQRV